MANCARALAHLFVILGASGIAVPQCITYIGLNYTTAVNGSLLTAGNPMSWCWWRG